jgi:hypothetical protein
MSPHVTPPQDLTATINGQPVHLLGFEVNQHVDHVTSRGPRPDPNWSTVDSYGHFHAYSGANGLDVKPERYPTLSVTREKQPCDGSCGGVCEGEGITIVRYACLICAEQIEPGLIEGPYTYPVAMHYEWTLQVAGDTVPVRFDERATVHLSDGRFGIALVTNQTAMPGMPLITDLTGVSSLGQHYAKAKRKPAADEPG